MRTRLAAVIVAVRAALVVQAAVAIEQAS